MVQLTVTGEARSWTSMDSEGLFCACFLVFLRLLWLIWMFYPRCSVFFFVVVFFAVVVFCFWLCQHFIACSSKKSRNPVYQTIFFVCLLTKLLQSGAFASFFLAAYLTWGFFQPVETRCLTVTTSVERRVFSGTEERLSSLLNGLLLWRPGWCL